MAMNTWRPMQALAAPVVLALAACGTAPIERPAEPPAPPSWAAGLGGVTPGEGGASLEARAWWAAWADEPLRGLQARALARNLDLAQAALRLERAGLQQQLAGLDQGVTPSLGAAASATRLVDHGPVTRSYSVNAGLGYEADLWGRLQAQVDASAANTEAQRADVAAARLLIRHQVAEHYWSLAALALTEPLIEAQRRDTAEVLSLTRLRVQEGKLLPIELDKIATSLQALQARLAQVQRERLQHRLALRRLLDEPEVDIGPAPSLPAAGLPPAPLGRPEEVLARRPDVLRARLQVDAALAQQRASAGARYPALSFNAGVGTGGVRWRDWLDQPLGTLAANLVVPLVDWRRLDAQAAQAKTDVELAALALRDSLHVALTEVEQLAAERLELLAQAEAQRARQAEAERNERLAQLRWEVGSLARADWLQVRSALMAAREDAIQLRLRQALNQAALQRALAWG